MIPLNKKQEEELSKDSIGKNDSLDIPEYEQKTIEEVIAKSDIEKFHLFTRLMRVHFMLKNAVIIK
ncbi:MAG: hypothetical protein ABIN25_06635 [Ginsengibacter sp.]